MNDGSHLSLELPADLDASVLVLRSENYHLRRALQTQPLIDRAKGMLMMRYGIDAETAFALLTRWSMNSNIKIRDLADVLTEIIGGNVHQTAPAGAVAWVSEQLRVVPATSTTPQVPVPSGGQRG